MTETSKEGFFAGTLEKAYSRCFPVKGMFGIRVIESHFK
jgi:hypothetical protein